MHDLDRVVLKGQGLAWCERPDCAFRVDGVWPETAAARARSHTRETGHRTLVRYEHTTVYTRPVNRDA